MEIADLQCDHCKVRVPEKCAPGWIHTSLVGLDIRTYDDWDYVGDFCSKECLVKHFSRPKLDGDK